MSRKNLLGIILAIIVIIALGGIILWQSGYLNPTTNSSPSPSISATPTASPNPSTTVSPSSTPEQTIQERIRDEFMIFTANSHTEIALTTQNLVWTGGKVSTGLGSTKYIYESSGWNVTIQNPVVPNPIYTIKANFTKNNVSIFLQGTWQNEKIAETVYTNNGLSLIEQVRNDIVNFIRTHADAVQYLQTYNWTGGNKTPPGIVGAATYSYINSDWNITMQYPIIPNPIYSVTAKYTKDTTTLSWIGTWLNEKIIETTYKNNQLPTQEQVLNSVVNFLRSHHTETIQYLQSLTWTKLSLTPEGMVGSSTYSYLNQDWNVTMQYPVVLNPIYVISAVCTSPTNSSQIIIAWIGTWQNQIIIETSYSYSTL